MNYEKNETNYLERKNKQAGIIHDIRIIIIFSVFILFFFSKANTIMQKTDLAEFFITPTANQLIWQAFIQLTLYLLIYIKCRKYENLMKYNGPKKHNSFNNELPILRFFPLIMFCHYIVKALN